MGQLRGHLWERAARSGSLLGGPTPPVVGDRMLAAVVAADAFVTLGGVLHLFDAAATRLGEVAEGYRYYRFGRMADFVEQLDLRLEGRMLSEVGDRDPAERRAVLVRSLPALGLVVRSGAPCEEVGEVLDLWYFTSVGPQIFERFSRHLEREPGAYAPPHHPCAGHRAIA